MFGAFLKHLWGMSGAFLVPPAPWLIFETCLEHLWGIFEAFVACLVHFWSPPPRVSCLKHFWISCVAFLKYVWGMSGSFLVPPAPWRIFETCLKHYWGMFEACLGHFWCMFGPPRPVAHF